MNGFTPGLLDRLMAERTQPGARLSLEQLKDAIARDLEALLNTRLANPDASFGPYPLARGSILNYGLADFAGKCLTSAGEREAVCASLKAAIEIHEPRLSGVTATLEFEAGSVNRLHFVIHAKLVPHPSAEPVNFNAVLQPSSLRYTITRAARKGAQPAA